MNTAFVNIVLRGLSLSARFVFLFFLGVFLAPEDVGLYGLFLSYITYSIYALGFEFYNYSSRELIKRPDDDWPTILRSQISFFLMVYAVVLPLMSLLFVTHLLPANLAIWFFPILILEHLSHELNRLLVAMSRPLVATVILFLRTGAWAIFVSVLMIFYSPARSLNTVFIFWLIGLSFATVVGGLAVYSRCRGKGRGHVSIDWVKRGIRVAIPLLAASLALRGLFSFDKILVEKIAGLTTLGAYTLFSSVASAVSAFVDAGVIVFYYPKIVTSAARKTDLDVNMRRLGIRVVGLSFLLIAGGMGVVWIALPLMGKAVYLSLFTSWSGSWREYCYIALAWFRN